MIEPRNPYEIDDGVTDLQDAVLGLLEDADIPTATNDQIMRLIALAEATAAAPPSPAPPSSEREGSRAGDRS